MWSGGRIASCRAFAAVPLGAGGAVPRYVSSAWIFMGACLQTERVMWTMCSVGRSVVMTD